MSDTIYVVTQGDYSDYRIKAMFSSREKAEAYIAKFPQRDMPEIEEWKLDSPSEWPEGMLRYAVSFDREGRCEVEQIEPSSGYEGVAAYGDDRRMHTNCWARDEQHAIKIANERRVQVIAAGDWETDWHKWRAREVARGNI